MIVKELHERDYETHVSCSEDILPNVSANAVLITSDEAHFYWSGSVNKHRPTSIDGLKAAIRQNNVRNTARNDPSSNAKL